MKSPTEIIQALKRGPSDVVGLDVGTHEVRAVRMHKSNDMLSIMGVAILDRPDQGNDTADEGDIQHLSFEPPIQGQYASLALDSGPAIIRLLTMPGKPDADLDERVVENLGLEDPDEYRISYTVLEESAGRPETRVVAVAYPDHQAAAALNLLPSSGTPAPHSIEVAGLATMTAFMNGPATTDQKGTLGLIDFGENSSLFAFFQRGVPILIRKLDRGSNALLDRVEATLGVDRATAIGIVSDGSFDISAAATEVMQPLIRQLVVSRDFVERRDNCKVNGVFLAGGLAASHDTQNEISAAMGTDVNTWNPFEGITMAPDALPDALQGQEWRFTTAVGACMGTLEES